MDFFQILSVISFGLSTYLTVQQIYDNRIRIETDIIALFKAPDMIYLKVSINNLSSNPIAITEATLSNRNNSVSSRSTHYKKTFASITRRTNGEVQGTDSLVAESVPINISSKSAVAFYLAFPICSDQIDSFFVGNATIDLKVNGRYYPTSFNPISKSFPPEQLQKELGRR